MNKEIDNFFIQIGHILHRRQIHKSYERVFQELDTLYSTIEHLKDTEDIYTGPLHIMETYAWPSTSPMDTLGDAMYYFKDEFQSETLLAKCAKLIPNDETGHVFLCLLSMFGNKVLSHRAIMKRVSTLNDCAKLTSTYDYGESVFGVKHIDDVPYLRDVMKQVFELITTAPAAHNAKHFRTYAVSDLFCEIYKNETPPLRAPLDLPNYLNVRKLYLRHIMHNQKTSDAYLDIFRSIVAVSDRFEKRALHYFGHTVGGVFTPIKGSHPGALSQWYEKECTDKDLDAAFDDIIKEEKRTFEALVNMGIGISIECNIRLTKKRFAKIERLVEHSNIKDYKELAGPFLITSSEMLACKILRRQIND